MKTTEFIKKLIINWCEERGKYGITLPYMVGAIRLKTGNEKYSAEDFFNDIPNVELDVVISICNELGSKYEYIIGTFTREYSEASCYKKEPVYLNGNIESKEKSLIDNDYQYLISFLTEKYSDKIEQEIYSKNPIESGSEIYKWGEFTEEEINTIKGIK